MFKCNENLSIERARGNETVGMHPNSFGCGYVPRSLISKRVKIPPVLFTRIG